MAMIELLDVKKDNSYLLNNINI